MIPEDFKLPSLVIERPLEVFGFPPTWKSYEGEFVFIPTEELKIDVPETVNELGYKDPLI